MNNMNPDWIVGFFEGEGSFGISIRRWKSGQTPPRYGITVRLFFYISQNERQILEQIQNYFGFGTIFKVKPSSSSLSKSNCYNYNVHKFQDHKKLREFFIKYPLKTKRKQIQFKIWSEAMDLMEKKLHYTKEGLLQLAKLRENNKTKGIRARLNYQQIEDFINRYIKEVVPKKSYRRWINNEVVTLKNNISLKDKDIGKLLNRSKQSVMQKRVQLNLYKYKKIKEKK